MTTGHDHRYALPPGHHLGEYRIDRYLGSGGFGITYLATDENLDLQVAIKEYLPSDLAMRDADNSVVVKTAEDEDDFEWGRERFLDEARSLARFNHPNIVRVQRFFEAHGTSYIVMDYVEGEPLSDLLGRKGTLTEAEIHQMILPLADGLADIHEAGLLHRDIKPSNIIIRDDGIPVLIDFGSARQAVGMKSRSMTSVVTPGYAPLEQYAAKSRQGPATDIYAFGAVLYRCVTGVAPDDATERAIRDEQMPAARAAQDRFNPSLLTGIDGALALRIEQRPENIATFLGALGDVGQPNVPAANPHFDTTSRTNKSANATNPDSRKVVRKHPLKPGSPKSSIPEKLVMVPLAILGSLVAFALTRTLFLELGMGGGGAGLMAGLTLVPWFYSRKVAVALFALITVFFVVGLLMEELLGRMGLWPLDWPLFWVGLVTGVIVAFWVYKVDAWMFIRKTTHSVAERLGTRRV